MLTFKQIRIILSESKRCYALWIAKSDTDQNYCINHRKHHKYWLYPTIEIDPRPWYGFDTKKELSDFVTQEFKNAI